MVYGAKARGVALVARLKSSARSGRRTDRVTVRNRGRKTTTFYAAVAVGQTRGKRLKLLNATYTLRAG